MYNTYTNDPGYLSKDFQRFLQVDRQGVQRVAKKYLTEQRMVLEVAPGKETVIDPDPRIPAEKAREQLAEERPRDGRPRAGGTGSGRRSQDAPPTRGHAPLCFAAALP